MIMIIHIKSLILSLKVPKGNQQSLIETGTIYKTLRRKQMMEQNEPIHFPIITITIPYKLCVFFNFIKQ